ncbi:MAG: hypothetical protein ACD_79C00756G0002 [uncultured bacterium]|nr:MAG: hypothetical protein ACD_79C00756G0002 [uncultured bacterium]
MMIAHLSSSSANFLTICSLLFVLPPIPNINFDFLCFFRIDLKSSSEPRYGTLNLSVNKELLGLLSVNPMSFHFPGDSFNVSAITAACSPPPIMTISSGLSFFICQILTLLGIFTILFSSQSVLSRLEQ